MQKPELVQAVKEITGVPATQVKPIVNAVFEAIEKAIVNGEEVEIRGLFATTNKEVAEHEGRNPKTGEKVLVPAHRKVGISLAKKLRKF